MEYKEIIDIAINELVYEKTKLIKAYNYYHGKRDPEQFRHLEENYGIGTPTSVEFVPLVRKHIDVLIGEYLSTPIQPKVSCKDEKTLSNIHRDKQLKILSEVLATLKKHLTNSIFYTFYENESNRPDSEIEGMINNLIADLDKNFISEYEIAAQNIIDWAMQARNIDFTNKRKLILTDLLVSGTAYYRVKPTTSKSGIILEVLNPLNSFIEKTPNSSYLKESRRSVVRRFMSKDQILNEYGTFLTKEDLGVLDSSSEYFDGANTTNYVRSFEDTYTGEPATDGILAGLEVTPVLPYDRNYSIYYKYYPVYEVEWIKTNTEFIEDRYSGLRIGNSIYVYFGKDDKVIRPIDDPSKCFSAVNGMFYSDRNGDPFSLIIATANLQDKFDVLNFYKDNLIAESGTKGDWIDVAFLPKIFGATLSERLMKWKAYKKQGLAIIDSSQEGEAPMNTTFGGFDDTIDAQAVQAIELALQSVENTCSTITGVFREKLGGIEQKDAVTNVQVGVRQSSYITKQFYHMMDLLTREMLIDILDTTKIVFKKGITGTLVLGDKLNKVFTALPEHYSATDHDIHIVDSSEVMKELELIKQLTFEFAKNNNVDAEIVIETISSSGLTNMKQTVLAAIQKKKQEANQVGQLSQNVEQLSQELKKAQQESQKLQQEVQRLNAEKLKLEREKLEHQKELEWFEAKSEDRFKDNKIEWEKKRVQLEGLQLIDQNPNNDEIKNN